MAATNKATGVFGSFIKWLDALSYSPADYEIERREWVTGKITDLERRVEQLERSRKHGQIAA